MSYGIYKVTVEDCEPHYYRVDLAQASATIYRDVDGEWRPLPYQTADIGHDEDGLGEIEMRDLEDLDEDTGYSVEFVRFVVEDDEEGYAGDLNGETPEERWGVAPYETEERTEEIEE